LKISKESMTLIWADNFSGENVGGNLEILVGTDSIANVFPTGD